MKQRISAFSFLAALTVAACSTGTAFSQDNVPVQRNPVVVHDTNHLTTDQAFRDMTPEPWHNVSKVMIEHDRAPYPHIANQPDSVFQREVLPLVSTTSLLNFDGITDAQGGGFVPPDTNAAVGATQVVETVNVAYAVYDKTTGAQLMAPVSIQTLYKSLGGQCATGNVSDPIVNYDRTAGRWVITMIAFNNSFSVNNSCVAVSTTSDATGTFHVYSFPYGSKLPDYPKVGVWPDAYYITTNSFPGGGSFSGAESCALNRTKMLAGLAATMLCFQRGPGDFSLMPSDLDGATAPPLLAPNYQLELGTSTTMNLFKFHVDFTTPKNSTFTGPTVITVAAYTDACATSGACIPQPSGGELLDALGDRLMYRLAYRNYVDHESLVVNHSVKGSGTTTSAVRWYELRSPGTTPVVFQSGTVGASMAFWMGSIAMDKAGDIALGFSASSSTLDPSVAYVGRVPTDVLGQMESTKLVIKGTGVQQNSFNRWGDYSSMQIDPVDDCTFWYAQEYYKTTGSFNFNTRLASFKFTTCH